MNYLSVENLSKTLGDKVLFNNISFGLSKGDKMALVGKNGTGKSTLLKIITGEILPDSGKVANRKGISIGFLSQNPHFEKGATIMDVIYQGQSNILNIIRDYEDSLISENNKKLEDAIAKMDNANAWDYESKVKQILTKFEIHDLDQQADQLSGGQKKRVALTKIIIDNPDLIIFDEPTNHLDIEMIEWLEYYLSHEQLTLLVVTHDRYFLDAVATQIVELDNGSLHSYNGDYAYYLEKKAERELQQDTEIEKARNLMRKELDWIRRQPKARGTKAKYRVEAFEGIKEKASGKKTEQTLEIDIKTTRLGSKILELSHISKSFGSNKVIDDFSYVFKKKDRIGIIGKNGSGKSTFLNMITGQLASDSGSVIKGDNTLYGYYGQEEARFKENERVIDVVTDIADVITLGSGQVITASQFLNRFQFHPSAQYDYAQKLSGGEKRRLQLLLVLMKNPNFLILDEPTNDLDINTLNLLEEFLMTFQGCLVVVSHDRYFMDRLVEHLFIFEKGKPTENFTGNYSDYRIEKEAEEALAKKKDQVAKKSNVAKDTTIIQTKPEEKRKPSFQEIKEFELLEKEIEALEAEKAIILDKLNKGSDDHQQLTDWSGKIEELSARLESKTNRWLQLSELV